MIETNKNNKSKQSNKKSSIQPDKSLVESSSCRDMHDIEWQSCLLD
jgi:hypothetical protein